ncbi:thioredoxin domain-containing protein [Nitrospirillum viridazoti]|uniref:Disulfide bond formation protein DsbA n=1 Tax=Nitrospirillum viridazoti CBAmc TaxID=1441467 RepID=A0A248JME8_9PROT|nr:thioredoxin domain-containing protein [Nitrospirillum amazonense]ASG19902.1 disulfide bond formation protein DsbA [Nitrospirillum amazonense CBAmc]TWB36425.1 protein-disulfide isomerase [Nitrospirillum amazonense]
MNLHLRNSLAAALVAAGALAGVLAAGAAHAQAADAPVTIDVASATSPRVLGDVKAPVVLEEYASFTCPHCAHFEEAFLPQLKADFIDTGQVQLVFHDFPLDQLAFAAEMAARCLPPDRYTAAKGLIFKTQAQWEHADDPLKALQQTLRLGGMSDATFTACLSNKPLQDFITQSRLDASEKLGVDGTPTFFVKKGDAMVEKIDNLREYSQLSEALVKAGAKAPANPAPAPATTGAPADQAATPASTTPASTPATSTPAAPAAASAAAGGPSTGLIVGGIVAALVVLGGIFMLTRRKK